MPCVQWIKTVWRTRRQWTPGSTRPACAGARIFVGEYDSGDGGGGEGGTVMMKVVVITVGFGVAWLWLRRISGVTRIADSVMVVFFYAVSGSQIGC